MGKAAHQQSIREETAEMVEEAAFAATVGLMREVLEKENLAQALLVAVAAAEHYDMVASESARQGHDTRMQRSIAAGTLIKDWLPTLEKEYKRVLEGS